VDVVASRVLGVSLDRLPLIRAAAAGGYGRKRADPSGPWVDSIESVAIKHFQLPPQEHLEWRLPEWMRTALKDALTTKPVIDNSACIQCGICQGHCPQGAIENRGRGVGDSLPGLHSAASAARSSVPRVRSRWAGAGRSKY